MKTTKKKSFKRLFAFLMAFVMVTALAANAVFAAGSFTDVKEGDDFYENIESLYEQGIIGGFPDGTFQPGEYLTRQQAAKMIALGSGYGEHDGTGSKLVDVADLTWGRENIWALEAAGVVKGFGTSKEFRPRLNITRGHVAKMIALAFGLKEGAEEVDLIDLPADEEVAEAIRVLASNGIVKGFGKSKEFRPDALVTRGQFAKMVDLAMKAAKFRVLDVRAINGLQVQIKFSEAVLENTVIVQTNKLNKTNIKLTAIDGVIPAQETAVLSDDGTTLTITSGGVYSFSGRAQVRIEDVKSEDGKRTITPFAKVIDFGVDTKAPEVVNVKAENEKAEITFDEKLYGISGISLDGVNLTSSADYEIADKVLTLKNLENGKTYTVEIVGAEDHAGNIADPIELTFTVLAPGEVPDQGVTISAAGNKVTLVFVNAITTASGEKVKFDPAVSSGGPHTLNGTDTNAIAYSKDKKTVTIDAQLLGVLDTLNYLETKVTVSSLGAEVKDVEKTVTLTADKVAPKFVSSEAKAGGKLQLVFDKDIKLPGSPAINLLVTHRDGVVQVGDGLPYNALPLDYAKDKNDDPIFDTLEVTLPMPYFEVDIQYAVSFANNQLEDEYGNKVDKFTTSFTIPDEDPVVDPKANITVEDPTYSASKIKVVFNATKNLTDASAVAANFKLGGVALPTGSTVQFLGDKKTIEIILPAGSIVTNGVRNLTLANITDLDGNTLHEDHKVKQVNLTENVPPTVKSVTAPQSNKVVIAFSENIKNVTVTGVTVKVNGAALTQNATYVIADDKLTVTLHSDDALELTDTVSVEFGETNNIEDLVGNKLAAVVVSK